MEKSKFALMTVHTGEVKQKDGRTFPINMVGENDLMTFKLKRDAWAYINSKNIWALIPCKVVEDDNRWMNNVTFYRFSL